MKIKSVTLFMKHNDMTNLILEDEKGNTLHEKDSDYFPDVGCIGGDDTEFKIDNETGKIIGWKPITDEDLTELKGEEADNDDNFVEEEDPFEPEWMKNYGK